MGRNKESAVILRLSITILTLMLPAYAGAGEAVEWRLAGRQGSCASLSLLERKGPEFRGIASPTDLAEKMRAAGHKVEIKEHNLAKPPAVEVRVPGRKLYVMFVKADTCRSSEAEKNRKAPGVNEQTRTP